MDGQLIAGRRESYLLVTEMDFKTAAKGGTESGTVEGESGTFIGTATPRNESQDKAKTVENIGESATFPSILNGFEVEDNGLEPMTSCMPCHSGINDFSAFSLGKSHHIAPNCLSQSFALVCVFSQRF